MIIVKCVKIDNYEHHRKLKIGETYYGEKNYSSWIIYDLNRNYIGLYHDYQFIDIKNWREEQLNKLKID